MRILCGLKTRVFAYEAKGCQRLNLIVDVIEWNLCMVALHKLGKDLIHCLFYCFGRDCNLLTKKKWSCGRLIRFVMNVIPKWPSAARGLSSYFELEGWSKGRVEKIYRNI